MNNLTVKGELQVCGITVPNINGGFGVDKKAMLTKHIAEIHNKKLLRVNEVIKNNIFRFREGVDIIDLKPIKFKDTLVQNGYLSQNSLNASKNIYLLSETGYRLLCNIFEDASVSKKILNEYFNSKSGIVIFAEKRKEILFRKEVDKIFNGLCNVIPQFSVDNFRIDMYIPELNIAIEFDEDRHEYYTEMDKKRQEYIEQKIGCKFVRIGEKEDYVDAVNKILKTVFGENGMTERDRLKLMFKSDTEKSWEMYEGFLDKVFR